MITTPSQLDALLGSLESASRVAVDTEFHSERHFYPRLMLIQVCVDGGEAHLVDPLAGLDLAPLGAALSRVPCILLHGGALDLQILRRDAGLRPAAVFDTQVAAGCVGGGYPVRLQELVRRHLGIDIPKAETLSDWSRRPLTPDQERYAAEDVLLLGPLADALEARLRERGNLAIADACTRELTERALAPEDDAEAWRSVPGAHLLDDEERACLQRLAAWRDGAARERDLPRSNVVSDAMLLDLARRRPASFDALRANRRMPSQVWKRDGAAVLERIAARSAPPEPPPGRGRGWGDLVLAAARVAELRRGVAPELILTSATLERLARAEPIEPWRAEALGSEFFTFLAGESGIFLPMQWRVKDNS